MARQIKITVLKRDLYKDLVEQYAVNKNTAQCEGLEDGQVFETNGFDKPEKLCSWAWADIQRDVIAVLMGGSYPWVNQKNTAISCCTDGFRPVTFKIEAFES